MITALVCLGSNAPRKSATVAEAFAFLARLGTVAADSGDFLSAPEQTPADAAPYLNRIVALKCGLPLEKLHALTKGYETAVRGSYTGEGVAVDIDIVYYSGRCLRPRDAASDYFLRGLELAKITAAAPLTANL